ncbi:neural cell adhesion molecule 2-like [Actinia tenebrosa]|uniref:Neural cell adhesion molecule 2-like n=1 Tax=Actinia tenebrosa TaxID=6105 RepID=A0A6P8J377_ACTTE|nr:neural cell adhesion molecule 2-like [Actinia tenebrosa]
MPRLRPTFLPSHPNNTYQIIEGKDLKINCTAIGPPTPTITWVNISDDSVHPKSHGSGSAVLQIDNIKRYHAGVYECRANNNPNETAATKRTKVTVNYPPKITHYSGDKTINEGGVIELHCLASGCPKPNITWSKKGGFLQHGGSLSIPRATRNDTDNYTCTANNFYGTDQHQVKAYVYVTVRYRPSIVYWTKDQIINETNPIHLTCKADGYPSPNITWTKSPDAPPVTRGNEYNITSVERSGAGTYTCTAKYADLLSFCDSFLDKPTISKELSSSNSTSWNGRQVTLKCIVSDGLPTPDITWYKPSGQEITTGVTSIAKGSQVVITTIDGADYGSYKCKATNIAGSVEHLINVTQLFPPGAPNVTILDQDIQASSVTVRWAKPGYDGGSPVIDYKVQINTNPPQEHNTSNTEHELTGLTKNTRYEVRVYTRNAVGYGNASNLIFTTKKRGPSPLPSFRLIKSTTTITLLWTKPDDNGGELKNYTIYQKQGVEKRWASIHVVRDLTNLTYVIHVKGLEPGQTYRFIVTATNEYGESEVGDDNGKKAYISPMPSTPSPTTEPGPNRDERKGYGDNKGSPVVIAGAVGAAQTKKRKENSVDVQIEHSLCNTLTVSGFFLITGSTKSTRSDRASYHNDIDPDSVTQQGAAASLGGVDDGIPTYAAVDVSKKKKKKEAQNEIADYAVVDKSKKKRPGEIIYAELADFNSPGEAAEAPRPITYTGTDYADITQFQKQDEPEPTYANFQPSKNFTNIQGM